MALRVLKPEPFALHPDVPSQETYFVRTGVFLSLHVPGSGEDAYSYRPPS